MHRKLRALAIAPLFIAASVSMAIADGDTRIDGKVEGKVFTDWSVTLKESEDPTHGFETMRAYFGYKMTVNSMFVGRVMFDVGRVEEVTSVSADTAGGAITGVSTKHDMRLEAYAKYAYLEIKKLIPKTSISFGLRGRHQFKVQEKFWGYRYLYKSFMDANKYGSTADLGLGIGVKPVDQLTIYFDVDNGEGYKKPQLDKDYRISLGTNVLPLEMLSLYVYGDMITATAQAAGEGQFTVAGFVGIEPLDLFRVGVEYDYQGNSAGNADATLNGISVYTTVSPHKVLALFARFDLLSKDDYQSTSKLVMAGAEYAPVKNLRIAPNVQIGIPAENRPEPTTKILLSGRFAF